MLAQCVDIIFTDFEKTKEYIKEQYRHKIVHVGNPYFENGEKYDYRSARKKLAIEGRYKYSVLVYGGSLGAANINANIVKWAEKYLKAHGDIKLTHATGALGYEKTKESYKACGLENDESAEVFEYIYDMPCRMAAADAVICRAGAMTLSELALMGKKAVLVPYPYAAENHQYKNAKVLEDNGAAILIEDSALTEIGYDSMGATAVSTAHNAIDQYALHDVISFMRLAELTGNRQWHERALAFWFGASQLISDGTLCISGRVRPAGSQDEAVFHTRWGRRTSKPFGLSQWLPARPCAFRLENLRMIKDWSILDEGLTVIDGAIKK